MKKFITTIILTLTVTAFAGDFTVSWNDPNNELSNLEGYRVLISPNPIDETNYRDAEIKIETEGQPFINDANTALKELYSQGEEYVLTGTNFFFLVKGIAPGDYFLSLQAVGPVLSSRPTTNEVQVGLPFPVENVSIIVVD